MIPKLLFDIGDICTLATDPDKSRRMVTYIQVGPSSVRYCLMFGTVESWHHEIEMMKAEDEKQVTAGFRKAN